MGDLYIGERIALLRRSRGMTQKQLAEKLNVSDKAVSRWERGESAPDLSLIPMLADLFGITCDELLRGEVRTPPASLAEAPAPKKLQPCDELLRDEVRTPPTPQAEVPAPKKLQTCTICSCGLILLGLTAALVCYLGIGYRYGVLGFFLNLAFCIGAGICQTIGIITAKEKTAVKKEKAANVAILALTSLSGSALIMNSSLDIGEILFLGGTLSSLVLLGGLFLKWFALCRDEQFHALRHSTAGIITGTLVVTAILALMFSMVMSASDIALYLGMVLCPIEVLTALCIYLWNKKQLQGNS